MELVPHLPNGSTMTAQRWCVRVLAIPYYLAIGPFLYDLFVHGVRWRSLYLFLYVILSVAGLQIGYKESDVWVRVWYWTNLPFVMLVTALAFFNPAFGQFVALYPWEKWMHFVMLLILTLFYPLRYFVARKPMVPIGEEDQLDEPAEPVIQRRAPSVPPTAPLRVPAPVPPTLPPVGEAPPQAPPEPEIDDDGGFLKSS